MADVVVAGGGIIGLTSAVRLLEAGHRVKVLSAHPPEQTVSSIAAAVWYPTHFDADDRLLRWGQQALTELTRQAGEGVPGVTMRASRMLLRGLTARPWWAIGVPEFRLEPPPERRFTGEWQFTVPAVQTRSYLYWLIEVVEALGGTIERRQLTSLAEAATSADVVVNATGLAAGALVPDAAVHPIRGRILVLSNPGITVSVRDEDDPEGGVYVHPRSRDVVVGGTFEPGQDDISPDASVTDSILRRCTTLVPELAQARVLREVAGLRPGRHGGPRLEEDARPLPGGVRLIHCYGHGGAGITLSWGCADEVTALVQS
ncbi:FAD-binding oxidoreductase [Kineosporia rhizophila]|uniref:FAD-dependent oxidoreductase n=1 Tax=Kineosporia TaxID=49184 RepID=UPI001E287C06|nr:MULTISPECIES: FAD-dependent oxidoreductase [Kineosporia]MCE0534771.1 FAD-binding oxidoreductase [Kineosporia rhizophila]GLY19302.1 D-amino-acid oxidase [Kineosporia sp. NBRC 101677]